MSKLFLKLLEDRRGATVVEYGMMVAVIAIVMLAGLSLVGSNVSAFWTNTANRMPNVSS